LLLSQFLQLPKRLFIANSAFSAINPWTIRQQGYEAREANKACTNQQLRSLHVSFSSQDVPMMFIILSYDAYYPNHTPWWQASSGSPKAVAVSFGT
jgi:hypothetical protein